MEYEGIGGARKREGRHIYIYKTHSTYGNTFKPSSHIEE
jgi:hypothetical protein